MNPLLPAVGALAASLGISAGLVALADQQHGVPQRATIAYVEAARHAPCPVDWQTLASIGAVESGHGTHGGNQIDPDTGEVTGAIFSSVGAQGPMQFMPETWARYATDGNGDGRADVNNIDDATASAARLLCANGVDRDWTEAVGQYSGGAGWRNYSESRAYVAAVAEHRIALMQLADNPTAVGAQVVIDFARRQLGKPYVYGGAGPDSWDCSGLTLAAYQLLGVNLPHDSTIQATMGSPVPLEPSAVRPGDLIFHFGDGYPNGHVGIATSSTTWIVAPRTGDVVKETAIPWDKVTAVRRFVTATPVAATTTTTAAPKVGEVADHLWGKVVDGAHELCQVMRNGTDTPRLASVCNTAKGVSAWVMSG